MKKSMKTRVLSGILAVILLLGILPLSGLAATDEDILAERRQIALDYMYKMATVIWRATEDIDYGAVTKKDPDDVAIGISRLNLVKGRLYQGVPYSYAGSTGEAFMEFATDADGDGVYEVEGLSWRALNGNSTYGARIGNDCSGAIAQAWGLFGSSNRFTTTHFWNESNGFLKVGDFNDYDVFDYREYFSTNGTQGTYGICEENGKDVIVAAYAHLQPADSVVHCKTGGHVMMVTAVDVQYKNGKVDPDASTVKVTHQTKTYSNAGKQAHYFHEGLQEEVYQILGLDDVYTFSKLFTQGYLPMTCKELRDPTPVPEAYVSDSVTDPSADTIVDGIISSNRVIDSVTMTISDANGKQLQQGKATTKRGTNYAFNMRQFVDDEYYTMYGYVNPYALPAGKYHCNVVCRLSNGQTFTTRDFDYDWTPIGDRTVDHSGSTCPMCGASDIRWSVLPGELTDTKKLNGANQHYYLSDDISNNGVYHLEDAGSTVCLDLNGHNLTSSVRVFVTNTDTTLRIMGDGTVSGGAGADYQGSVLDLFGHAVLFGGTYQLATPVAFPVVSTRGFYTRVDMYDGAVIQGISGSTMAPVLMTRGVFNMHGGKVTGGNSSDHGGNFYIGYKTGTATDGTDTYECELYMFGGVIENGTAAERGGNVYVVNEGEAHICENALITGGKAKNGGNIEAYAGGYVTINGATVRDGYAKDRGGNLYAYGVSKNAEIVVNDALIEGGTASKAGGNIEAYGGTITLNNSTIQNGRIDKASTYGGNLDVRKGGTIILNSGIVTGGEAGTHGGNIGVTLDGQFIMNGGTVKNGKTADATKPFGKNIYLYSDGHMVMNGGTVETAKTGEYGNGVYLQGKSTLTLAGAAVIADNEDQLAEGIYVQSSDGRLLVDNSFAGQASVKWYDDVDQTVGATLPETAGVCGTTADGVFTPGGTYEGVLTCEAGGYVLGAEGKLQIAATLPEPEPEPVKNGWAFDGGKWYYYENGAMVKKAWREDSKGWVYLGEDGAMLRLHDRSVCSSINGVRK